MVFSNMSYLENAEKQKCYCGQEGQDCNNRIKDRNQAMQEEISNFFKGRKSNLAEKDINVVQNDNFSRGRMRERISETKVRDLTDMRNLADLDERYFDLKRREGKPKSSACFTWSSSQSRSSIHAVDLRCRAKEPDNITKCPRFSVQNNLEKEAVRSLSTRMTNGELDKNYFTKRRLRTNRAEKYPGRESSLLLVGRSVVDPDRQQERLMEGNRAEGITRRNNDKTRILSDKSSFPDIVKPKAVNKICKGFNERARYDFGSQEDEEVCRLSSPVGRLLKECNNALDQRPREQSPLISNMATKDHRWLPERAKESSFYNTYNVKPQYESETRPPNDLHNQVFTIDSSKYDKKVLKVA